MKNDLPIVTVVTPTFNIIKEGREEVLMECINSVKEQSYKNIEHIFIDNVSDDGTVELLNSLGLKVYSEPDTGIFNAFNKGVQRARGKYVIFLGSDDYYHSKFGIEMSVKGLESENADFCFSESLFTLDNETTQVFKINLFNAFKVIPYSHQTVLCKREVLLETPFDESYKIAGDVHWNIRMVLKKYKSHFVDFNFVYNRFTGACVSNYEQGSIETDRLYKELYYDIFPFDDETLHEMSFFRVFPKELEEYFSTFFNNQEEYFQQVEAYNKEQEVLKGHKLLADLIQRSKELNGNVVAILEREFNLPAINNYLYIKLDEESQKIYVDFFLKRFGGLNTIDEEEEKYLDDLFTKARLLADKRKSIEDPININFNGKELKYFSFRPVAQKDLDKEQELIAYFDIVHSFFINEYDLDGYQPKDGEVIFDCGAYMGDTALMFSAMYPNSPVYSFECDDIIFQYLKKNVEANNFKNVRCVKAFLSNKIKDSKITIDNFVKKHSIKNIGMIKFDIEGAERLALEGAIKTIKKYKPILIIPIYHLPDDSAVISKFINDLGMPATLRVKWLEKRVYGVDCSLFVKFD